MPLFLDVLFFAAGLEFLEVDVNQILQVLDALLKIVALALQFIEAVAEVVRLAP